MTKQEFLDTLRRSLAGSLTEGEVADNINYYWNYIEQQIASGKSEEQVLLELGDPRLIARTILQVDERREEESGGSPFSYQEEVFTDNGDGTYDSGSGSPYEDLFTRASHGSFRVHRMTAMDWIKIALVLIIIFMILGAVFHILWKLLPVLLIVAAGLWVYRRFFER